MDDVLTSEDVYDLKNDKILSDSLEQLQKYFEGSESSTRQYLETVKTGVKGYVEQQLRSAITSKVKSGVTDLNSQIATINEMLADAKKSFDAANTKITDANDQISELNDAMSYVKIRPGVKFCVSDFRQSQEWRWKAGRILA